MKDPDQRFKNSGENKQDGIKEEHTLANCEIEICVPPKTQTILNLLNKMNRLHSDEWLLECYLTKWNRRKQKKTVW